MPELEPHRRNLLLGRASCNGQLRWLVHVVPKVGYVGAVDGRCVLWSLWCWSPLPTLGRLQLPCKSAQVGACLQRDHEEVIVVWF